MHHSCISLTRHNAGWHLNGRLPAGTLLCIFCLMACFSDSQTNVESGLHHLGFHLETGRPLLLPIGVRFTVIFCMTACCCVEDCPSTSSLLWAGRDPFCQMVWLWKIVCWQCTSFINGLVQSFWGLVVSCLTIHYDLKMFYILKW